MAGDVAVARRRFDASRDARRFVMLTDGRRLLEVIAVRGFVSEGRPEGHAAVKVLDVVADVPAGRGDELEAAEWLPLAEVELLEVVGDSD